MIGLVMAGGRGTRMRSYGEKLLLKYRKPAVLHVLDAMYGSGSFSKILAVTSPNSPMTRRLLIGKNYTIVESSGAGYAKDLNSVLQKINDAVFVTSADMPLLDGDIIRQAVQHYTPETWTSILVTKKFLNSMGLDSNLVVLHGGQLCAYTGISLIDSTKIHSTKSICERFLIFDDRRIAFNLNEPKDYDLLGTV